MNHKKSSVQKFHASMSFGRGYPTQKSWFFRGKWVPPILVSFHFSGDFPLSLQLLEFFF